MRAMPCCALCLLVFVASAAAEEPAIPAWFKPDPKNPYAVFDAWRNLSTTEAMLCWDDDWGALRRLPTRRARQANG